VDYVLKRAKKIWGKHRKKAQEGIRGSEQEERKNEGVNEKYEEKKGCDEGMIAW